MQLSKSLSVPAVLEGVMGLYDGLGGIYEQGSSYHLAKVTQTPIILVVDAKGMGKSVHVGLLRTQRSRDDISVQIRYCIPYDR